MRDLVALAALFDLARASGHLMLFVTAAILFLLALMLVVSS